MAVPESSENCNGSQMFQKLQPRRGLLHRGAGGQGPVAAKYGHGRRSQSRSTGLSQFKASRRMRTDGGDAGEKKPGLEEVIRNQFDPGGLGSQYETGMCVGKRLDL